jgi:glutamyl-tRNA reductase
MLQSFAVIHVPGSRKSETPVFFGESGAAGDGWVSWRTCLRSIWIGVSPGGISDIDLASLSGPVETYSGEAAYSFLLEVVCGLHSPLAGETEVMGQFRELAIWLKERKDLGALGEIFRSVLTDAKSVRRTHLTNLGSQSYGSLTRKVLKNSEMIHVLGSGQLAEEILPWLKSFRSVEVFCRNAEKRTELSRKFPGAQFAPLEIPGTKTDAEGRTALIIAAPMPAAEIADWITRHGHRFEMLVDLRGEAETDPLLDFFAEPETVRLGDFFTSMEANLETIRARVVSARKNIGELSRTRGNHQEIRPFGWEDLCG